MIFVSNFIFSNCPINIVRRREIRSNAAGSSTRRKLFEERAKVVAEDNRNGVGSFLLYDCNYMKPRFPWETTEQGRHATNGVGCILGWKMERNKGRGTTNSPRTSAFCHANAVFRLMFGNSVKILGLVPETISKNKKRITQRGLKFVYLLYERKNV